MLSMAAEACLYRNWIRPCMPRPSAKPFTAHSHEASDRGPSIAQRKHSFKRWEGREESKMKRSLFLSRHFRACVIREVGADGPELARPGPIGLGPLGPASLQEKLVRAGCPNDPHPGLAAKPLRSRDRPLWGCNRAASERVPNPFTRACLGTPAVCPSFSNSANLCGSFHRICHPRSAPLAIDRPRWGMMSSHVLRRRRPNLASFGPARLHAAGFAYQT